MIRNAKKIRGSFEEDQKAIDDRGFPGFAHSIGYYTLHIIDKTHSYMKMRCVRYIICTIVCRKRIHNNQLVTTYVSAKNSRVISHEYRFPVDNSYMVIHKKFTSQKISIFHCHHIFQENIEIIENKKFFIKFKK